jgi:hypothetical protein
MTTSRYESSPSIREDQDLAKGVWRDVHDHVMPGGLVMGEAVGVVPNAVFPHSYGPVGLILSSRLLEIRKFHA